MTVDTNTGSITLAKKLDYETSSVYELIYQAHDGGNRITSVDFTVNVLDYNDEAPVFDVDEYQTFGTESSTELIPNVTVRVSIIAVTVLIICDTY